MEGQQPAYPLLYLRPDIVRPLSGAGDIGGHEAVGFRPVFKAVLAVGKGHRPHGRGTIGNLGFFPANIAFAGICVLIKIGYKRESIVTKTGEIGVRGFILDIFPLGYDHPIRIEFFGNTIDFKTMEYDSKHGNVDWKFVSTIL